MKHILSGRLGQVYEKIKKGGTEIQEIRLRSHQPLMVRCGGETWMIDANGSMCRDKERAVVVRPEDIQESMAYICQYSLYAYEDEIRQGYITVKGGHRVGVAGQVSSQNGQVQSMPHITSLNIRVAHQVRGCGEKIFPWLWEGNQPCHTLILSPPGGGKTTLLRDLIRLFSDGFGGRLGQSVSLVDERSEVAAGYMGILQNDVGCQTDVLDGCPKAAGIEMMVRSMGPQILAFDELGGDEDISAVRYAARSGCKVLATLHGCGRPDVERRFGDERIFERYVVLEDCSTPGKIEKLLDQNYVQLCGDP